ncbi:MAG: hypothetical protein PHQ73_01035 [Gallionella sp.]|nr:hypothetical protein [Gallionella sp.]
MFAQADWGEADVLVIGDSFSVPGIWQTALTRAGLRVRTETWTNLPAICEDFSAWAHDQGFRGRYVIVEIIERNTPGTLGNSIACKNTAYRPAALQIGPPATLPVRNMNDHSGRLSVGLQVYLNSLNYLRQRQQDQRASLAMPGGVHVHHLDAGCQLFSHPQCEDVLFFDQDQAGELGQSVQDDMRSLAKRITGAQLIWAIVPDKTTTYLHPEKTFWKKIANTFQSPDILAAFTQATQNRVVDLYRGNNTHLSTTGYLLMGEAIYQSMNSSQTVYSNQP